MRLLLLLLGARQHSATHCLLWRSGELQHINVRGCKLIGDGGVKALGEFSCESLANVSVEGCSEVTDAGVGVGVCQLYHHKRKLP